MSHVGSVTTYIKMARLRKDLVDSLRMISETVLDVHLFVALARSGRDQLESVAEYLLIVLYILSTLDATQCIIGNNGRRTSHSSAYIKSSAYDLKP